MKKLFAINFADCCSIKQTGGEILANYSNERVNKCQQDHIFPLLGFTSAFCEVGKVVLGGRCRGPEALPSSTFVHFKF